MRAERQENCHYQNRVSLLKAIILLTKSMILPGKDLCKLER